MSASASRLVGWVVLALLAALLVDVLFEGWVQQLFGHQGYDPVKKMPVWEVADWPKDVKSALFLALLAATLVKVFIDRSWRDFLSRAEVALAVLGVVMVVAGLIGGSSPMLIGQALFVYFRGVIVFFAWRALKPSWRQLKPILIGLVVIASVNALMATVETIVGYPSYQWLGWTDLTWARIARAHAFLNHPNHLGHFLLVVTLGLAAWFTTMEKVPKKLWWLFGFLAFGLSAAQSRESAIGFVVGVGVIWWMRRRPVRPLVILALIMIALIGLQSVASPKNRAVFTKRLMGVFAALHLPAGSAEEEEPGVPAREIRLLFYQQGILMWAKSPVVGYGVGQFGGIVAYQANPKWNEDFGFRLYGAKPDQVDSFWLHLVVETGTLGLLAYLGWQYFLIRPLIQFRVRGPWFGKRSPRGPPTYFSAYVLWGPAVLAAALVLGLLSPSLEDPIFPTLMFTALGLAWVSARQGEVAGGVGATGLDGPARKVVEPVEPAPEASDASTRSVTEEPSVDGKRAGNSPSDD